MKSILIRNGLITDIESGDVYKKDILIENGKISAISEKINYESENLNILDAKEQYILPGLIDCHTHLGIIEEATGKIGVDNNETSEPVTPHLRGIDAINPMDIAFNDALKSGITTVMSGPGSDNAVGGLSSAIKTSGVIIDKMILKDPVGFKIALGENPITTYGTNKKCPVTRMGTASLIRELLMKTQDYIYLKDSGKIEKRDIRLEAVIPLLKGQIPLRAHAHRADDIVTAVRIAEEFKISRLVIEHGTEAHLVKEYLKEKDIPVALGPMLTPRIKMEMSKRNYNSICELVKTGVRVALITDHPYNSIDQLRTIAMLSISEGLNILEALKSITIHPAEILQCDERIGRLEVGFDGDIAIFDKPPFDIKSKVIMTLIGGEIVYRRE